MKLVDTVQALVAAGASPDMILAVVRADQAEQDARKQVRREKDAERQRRKRSRDVTQSHADGCGQGVTPRDPPETKVSSPSPPSSQTQSPQKPPSPPLGALSPNEKRSARRCPADYQPGLGVLNSDAAKGFMPGEIERQLARFKDHQFHDARSDWDATFRNWLRKAHDDRPRINGHDRQAHFEQRTLDILGALDAAAELEPPRKLRHDPP